VGRPPRWRSRTTPSGCVRRRARHQATLRIDASRRTRAGGVGTSGRSPATRQHANTRDRDTLRQSTCMGAFTAAAGAGAPKAYGRRTRRTRGPTGRSGRRPRAPTRVPIPLSPRRRPTLPSEILRKCETGFSVGDTLQSGPDRRRCVKGLGRIETHRSHLPAQRKLPLLPPVNVS
jgi:hypothetical protein